MSPILDDSTPLWIAEDSLLNLAGAVDARPDTRSVKFNCGIFELVVDKWDPFKSTFGKCHGERGDP